MDEELEPEDSVLSGEEGKQEEQEEEQGQNQGGSGTTKEKLLGGKAKAGAIILDTSSVVNRMQLVYLLG